MEIKFLRLQFFWLRLLPVDFFPILLRMQIFRPLCYVFLIVLFSCSSPTGDVRTEMEFTVDSSLVSREVTDAGLGISYLVPQSWSELQAPPITGQPIAIHQILQRPDSSATFSLTDIRHAPDSNLQKLDKEYATILNPTKQWQTIDKAEFEKPPFQVKQFVLSNAASTHFKLLFFQNRKPFFQIDYTSTVDTAYQTNTKTLESILGSLQPKH